MNKSEKIINIISKLFFILTGKHFNQRVCIFSGPITKLDSFFEITRVHCKIFRKGFYILLLPAFFNCMFQLVLCQETTEHGEEQHNEFPEVMDPFFPGCMSVLMDFHEEKLTS